MRLSLDTVVAEDKETESLTEKQEGLSDGRLAQKSG